jgi:hypothetical protein
MRTEQNGRQLFKFVISLVLIALLAAACGPKAPAALSEADSQATVAALVEAKAAQTAAAMAAPVVEAPTAEPPADTPAPAPEPTVEAPAAQPQIMPGEPPEPNRTLEDVNSSYFAYEHKATAGENYLNNLFERPFTSEEMIYQPDLDITTVDQSSDDAFYYFTIRLYAEHAGRRAERVYGIEFDRTQTGRGDLLVQVLDPAYEWSTQGVTIYGDKNRDVGGLRPIQADTGFTGSGYDMTIEQDAEKTAFARIDPTDGNAVQFAVSKALLENTEEFLWGAWADNGLKDVTKFDLNDTMGPTAAGSPIKDKYYPVKAIFNLDNTCRLPVGLAQSGTIPGMCKIAVVEVKHDKGGGCPPGTVWWCINTGSQTICQCVTVPG